MTQKQANFKWKIFRLGLSWWHSSGGKESACNARDPGSIPVLGRSPGEGNGNPLQYPSLGNPMDRGAWWRAVRWGAKHDLVTKLQQQWCAVD